MANQDMLFPVLPKPPAPIHHQEHQQQQNKVQQVDDKPPMPELKQDEPNVNSDGHQQSFAHHSPAQVNQPVDAEEEPAASDAEESEPKGHHIDIRI